MNNNEISSYIDKYLQGKATRAEAAFVENWYQSFDQKPGLTEQLSAKERENFLNSSLAAVWAAIGVQ